MAVLPIFYQYTNYWYDMSNIADFWHRKLSTTNDIDTKI